MMNSRSSGSSSGGSGGGIGGGSAMMRRRVPQLDGLKEIDPNDIEFLRKFVTEQGKILPSRFTGATPLQQRKISRAVRRARTMGLLR